MISLKKNHDRRIRRGHLWVFSNEIADPPVSRLEPGSTHEMRDASGEFLGMVYVNPSSLIAARILSRRRTLIDEDFFRERILSALELRKRLFPFRESFRLIFSESDLLPGLVVDKYGSVLVVQSLTAGMDALLEQVVGVLVDLLSPDAVYLRNDSPMRLLEGLQQEKRLAYGTLPDNVTIVSGALRLLVDVVEGQKTGFFLDQESNRLLMDGFTFLGARVLDLFSYTGAWGLHAAAAGAGEVTAVDTSERALGIAEANAETNGLASKFRSVREPVIDFLKKTHETWDLIVLDPPAFIKSKAHLKEGIKGYIDANRRALTKLNPGGILVTCSCSHHLDTESFEQAILAAARQSGKELRILDVRGQGPDHPFLLTMPETRYLKLIAAQAV
ncbi:MAG: class I SAM-dependent rRNA methyltransferase [Desulfomonile tiedjei]|uniref:Class I SAM-dependent rRNA methyltransferase n=1 Tax=Desulfomonile tiedjei TaxID=2358 RepID=A0A9D6V508_9BACT|nr:class I SAM-dependent rRNA methyltransferase [Desulfomonile tiedjei]